jgi:hypothetical protein
MTGLAEALQVGERVGSTVGQWFDVINFGGWSGVAVGLAVDTERMGAQLHGPYATPTGIIAALGCGPAVGVDALIALGLVLSGVGGAVAAATTPFDEGSTPPLTARTLGFAWHGSSLLGMTTRDGGLVGHRA